MRIFPEVRHLPRFSPIVRAHNRYFDEAAIYGIGDSNLCFSFCHKVWQNKWQPKKHKTKLIIEFPAIFLVPIRVKSKFCYQMTLGTSERKSKNVMQKRKKVVSSLITWYGKEEESIKHGKIAFLLDITG